MPEVPFANSYSLSDTTVFVDDKVVVVPVTVILPQPLKSPATLKPSPAPISTLVESVDLITLLQY